MEEGLTDNRMYVRLKNEQVQPPLPQQGLNLWDSTESDTESLAQERAYQQEQQRRLPCQDKTSFIQPQEHNVDSLQQGEEEKVKDEDLQVYDSLEVPAPWTDRGTPATPPTLAQDAHTKESSRSVSSEESYSDLRYDPNWRTNLKGAGLFNGTPHLSPEEEPPHLSPEEEPPRLSPEGESPDSDDKAQERRREREEPTIKGEYRYITATSPTFTETPHTTSDESKQPYHLHPPQSPVNHAPGDGPPDPRLPRPTISPERDEGRASQTELKVTNERNRSYSRENHNQSELEDRYKNIHAKYTREYQAFYEQEQTRTQGKATKKQPNSFSKLKGPKILRDKKLEKLREEKKLEKLREEKKLEKLREDIIERNKMTLGLNTAKGGSYLKAHALKSEMSETLNQVCDAAEDAVDESREENLENSTDPELRWTRKTQQLKLSQTSKEKKTRGKGNLKRPPERRCPTPERRCPTPREPSADTPPARSRPDPHNSSSSQPVVLLSDTDSRLANQPSPSQPKPTPLTQPGPAHLQLPPPTIHLNIHLNTSADLLPLLQHIGQGAVLTLPSPHSPHRNPDVHKVKSPLTSDYRVPLPSPCGSQRHVASPTSGPSQLCQGGSGGLKADRWHQKDTPARWQRLVAPKWPPSHKEQNQRRSPNEIVSIQCLEDSPRPPFTSGSQDSGAYVVLPPIGRAITAGEPELSPGHSESIEGMNPVQRCFSDGYLALMEKQKQLKERATYKAYTLKDYKQLNQEVILRGLGPDYTAVEETAERVRKQKLYSQVIQEQNRRISRIPFLLAKDPQASHNNTPRKKALDYSKTIARLQGPARPKPRQNQPSVGSLAGLDLSHLTTLELLRKRHEEEKQAVACFQKLHAV